ncbi:hypothetical protein Gpo141_00009992 [Globisporangium polare]
MATTTTTALRECSLEELRKEPWRLQIQAENAAEQLRNLVLKNYHLFIQSNQCSAIVKDDLTQLKDETDQIVDFIPELKAYCASFQQEVASVVSKHGDIQFVFEHYLQLTELLDIPQLLEACIHNELFDSALDVIQFANETFQTREGQAMPNFVIATLVREVAQMTSVMREKLLQKLREDLQLALCVRIVSYLRRLDGLVNQQQQQNSSSPVGTPDYEKQLKEEFLSCRNVWLSSLSRGVSAADPYQYTIQVIDIKRTSWFDMITQYSAIFGNETVDGKVDPPLCRWATTTVADFIQILMKQLPKIDDFSSLATILEQSLFFGGSLGRVGVDFRAILVVYFEDHVLELMGTQWRSASREFQDSLNAHALSSSSTNGGVTPSSYSKTPIVIASYRSAAYADGSSNGISPFASRAASANGEDYSPPHALMAFPILAEFTNALLTSLNELRLCTIASLQTRLAKKLQSTICAVILATAEFCEDNKLRISELTPNVDGQQNGNGDANPPSSKRQVLTEALQSTVEILRKELIPYLIKCFHRLYGNKAPSAALLNMAYFDTIMKENGVVPQDASPAT